MKATETKTTTTATLQKKGQPFFEKGVGRGFFSNHGMDTSFFKSRPVIQPKLTIGQPDDKYEKEADAVADKVVQRLAMPDELTKKETGVQTKSLASDITPFIQKKCETCEKEERFQKKEDSVELQRKPIFEIKTEPTLQMKCTECENEEEIQKKDTEEEEKEIQEKPEQLNDIQCKPIFESEGEPAIQKKVAVELERNGGKKVEGVQVASKSTIPGTGAAAFIQTKCAACEQEERLQKREDEKDDDAIPLQAKTNDTPHPNKASESIEAGINSAKGGGSALPNDVRSRMESSFGTDFRSVRIHNDIHAIHLSKELNAQAFTHGHDIYFNTGKYDVNNNQGQHLLAHELTHVVQQRSGLQTKPQIQKDDDPNQSPSPSADQSVEKNPFSQQRLHFRFRTDRDLPAAKKGASNTPKLVWDIKSAFNLDEATAEQIVSVVQWVPLRDTRAYKKGEFIEYSLNVPGIVETLKHLAFIGKVDEKAVKKFEELIAMQEAMTHRDMKFFIKAKGKKFTNLNVDGFTVENLNKIEAEIQQFINDKESVLGPLGLLDEYYRTKDVVRDLDFEALKDRLFNKSLDDLTVADKEQILSLFRNKAMRKVFVMLDKANTIAGEELKRYRANKQDLTQLILLLTGTFGPSYTEADKVRVKGIYKFIDEFKPDYYSVPGGSMTDNFRQIIKYAPEGETALLKRISQIPAGNISFQIENFFTHRIMRSGGASSFAEAQKQAKGTVSSKYPEFTEADKKDAVTYENLKSGPTKQYPILYDLSLDFRILSRLSASELETKILNELEDKKKKSAETERRLVKEPWLIWEFQPLLYALMAEEGLSKDNTVGKVINDKIESVKDYKFWRSIALAALGIALGIAGFFTGGATWAGLALITGSVIVNLIDLHYELKDYALHAAAAGATFEGGLTQEPSSIGVIFAIGGLVLDFVDVLKIIKPIAKPLKTIGDVTSYAEEIFKQLESAGKLQKGVTKEAFVKALVENWTKRESMVKSLAPDIKKIVEGDAFKSLHQGVQEGLFKVFDADRDAFMHLVKTFGDNPELLTRLGAQAMIDPKAAEGIASLYRLTKESAITNSDDIFRYYGSIGSNALSSVPDVLNVLRRGTIASQNPELAKLILTNRNLQQALLKNASDPDILLRHWEQYQLKLAGLPSGSPKPDFVKYLDEQKAGTRLAEESAGIPQKIDLPADQIEITAKLSDKDLAQVKQIIQDLVKERGFVSGQQMQAIIRVAEAAEAHVATTLSKNLRGFLWQLRNASTQITKNGMKQDNLFALLRGLENPTEFSTALKLVDSINSGSNGLKSVDELLSSMTISNLDDLVKFEDAAFSMSDAIAVANKVKVTSNADGQILSLAIMAGQSTGKTTDLRRLRNIVEALEDGKHSFDTIERAIKEADLFDQKLAKALAESGTGLEAMAKLVWGTDAATVVGGKITLPAKFSRKLGKAEGSGSLAYKAVFGNEENVKKLIKGIMSGSDIDPIKWAILRKTITDSNIDDSIKNLIVGKLWGRAAIESYSSKGYKLFRGEIPIKLKSPGMDKAKKVFADAVFTNGDEIFILEFKSGEAVFERAQETIYTLIKQGKWEDLTFADAALEKMVKANPDKVKFIEVREPYSP